MQEMEGQRAHHEVCKGMAYGSLCGERQEARLAILHEVPLYTHESRIIRTIRGLDADSSVLFAGACLRGALLLPQGFEHLGGGDDLADMALGMIGDVDERSADAGGKLFAADAAESVEIGGGEGTDAFGGV